MRVSADQLAPDVDELPAQPLHTKTVSSPRAVEAQSQPQSSVLPLDCSDEIDQIPVRLSGGRRAWLVVPIPFYTADKSRLKAQIDLLLAEDEEGT